ncbi:hypothetical protein HMI56_004648, partial [Coelomomyces lativittatus]
VQKLPETSTPAVPVNYVPTGNDKQNSSQQGVVLKTPAKSETDLPNYQKKNQYTNLNSNSGSKIVSKGNDADTPQPQLNKPVESNEIISQNDQSVVSSAQAYVNLNQPTVTTSHLIQEKPKSIQNEQIIPKQNILPPTYV